LTEKLKEVEKLNPAAAIAQLRGKADQAEKDMVALEKALPELEAKLSSAQAEVDQLKAEASQKEAELQSLAAEKEKAKTAEATAEKDDKPTPKAGGSDAKKKP
jgi:SMC interacting uncharacterized protein involved in chromosome segregation